MGCCCSGGGGRCYEDANVKEDQEHLTTICRDAHSKHAKRTKACEALQYFPFSIDIFPGIYGEVALENQSRWIINANALDSNHPHESNGTRVIIPIFGGLIELFAFKHVSFCLQFYCISSI
ncbi:hypothetical protein Q3G72_010488 [Acer saccharum]|nr:hypothetical protein Q3G72_010488 [Acer saccharum]